jgi:hypothetical protein
MDDPCHLNSVYLLLVMCPESSWNVMVHGDARKGKWRGNWRMEWVASTLHTTSEHGLSSITTADAHSSPVSSRLNWSHRQFKWIRPFRRKTKSGFYASAITFQTQSTGVLCIKHTLLLHSNDETSCPFPLVNVWRRASGRNLNWFCPSICGGFPCRENDKQPLLQG